jgi:hypothetical protein
LVHLSLNIGCQNRRVTRTLNLQNNVTLDDPREIAEEKLIDLTNYFNDELWSDMWYLNRGGVGSHNLDMNVYEAWAEGYTGRKKAFFEKIGVKYL